MLFHRHLLLLQCTQFLIKSFRSRANFRPCKNISISGNAFILVFIPSLNVLSPINFLSEKNLFSPQGLIPIFWKQTSQCLDVNSDIYQLPDFIYITDLIFAFYITGRITSKGYFEEFNDMFHVEGLAHFLVHKFPTPPPFLFPQISPVRFFLTIPVRIHYFFPLHCPITSFIAL